MLKYWLFFLVCFLPLPNVYAKEESNFQTLDRHIFIGQAYPSGKVYVRRFMENPGAVSIWPKTISLLPLTKGVSLSPSGQARFVQTMKDKIENHVLKSAYIPGIEGMDEDHDACGMGKIKKANPAHKKLSADFFDTILDHCETNNSVAIYQITPSNYSYMVLGTDSNLTLTAPEIIKGSIRPLTVAEKQLVKREKSETKKSTTDYECTTVPAYLDSAKQIFAAKVKGNDTSLRLSTYLNPGCAGHLGSIYVLDITRNNKLLKSFGIYQYQGAL